MTNWLPQKGKRFVIYTWENCSYVHNAYVKKPTWADCKEKLITPLCWCRVSSVKENVWTITNWSQVPLHLTTLRSKTTVQTYVYSLKGQENLSKQLHYLSGYCPHLTIVASHCANLLQNWHPVHVQWEKISRRHLIFYPAAEILHRLISQPCQILLGSLWWKQPQSQRLHAECPQEPSTGGSSGVGGKNPLGPRTT